MTCDCAERTPTYPVYRDTPHVPGCRFYSSPPTALRPPADEHLPKDSRQGPWTQECQACGTRWPCDALVDAELERLNAGQSLWSAPWTREEVWDRWWGVGPNPYGGQQP